MCKTKIRNFSVRDLSRVLEIERLSFREPYGMSVFLHHCLRDPDLFLVTEFESEVTGYIMTSSNRLTGEGKIVSIAVDPSHRKKGFGRNLIMKTMERLKKGKAERVSLEVRKSNLEAIMFYASLGFKRERVMSSYYCNGEDAVRMLKRL
jgi:ribosomal-protein-alanine N-acetyltransferase